MIYAYVKDKYIYYKEDDLQIKSYIGEALLDFAVLSSTRAIQNSIGFAMAVYKTSDDVEKAFLRGKKYTDNNAILQLYLYELLKKGKTNSKQAEAELMDLQVKVKEDLSILLNSVSIFDVLNGRNFDYLKSLTAALTVEAGEVVDLYSLNSVDDVICFEMLQIIKNNIMYKKCKYCGNYFILKGRTDSEYCRRIMDGEQRPCCEIGAGKVFDLLHKNDEIFLAYQKAYRRMDSRKRMKTITSEEFKEWGKEARRLRKLCYDGELSLEKYMQWLEK